MRITFAVVALTTLAAGTPTASATVRFNLQTTVYEASGVNLVPEGALEPFQVLNSKSVEVSDLVKEAFPGLPVKLRTFPMMSMPVGERQGMGFAKWGSLMMLFTDGAIPNILFDEVTMEGVKYPPLKVSVSPGGGSVSFLLGGKQKTFIVFVDVMSGADVRWDDPSDAP